MTFTQLEYVLAVFRHRHFAAAAADCFVTQPTLSMQIHKLEVDLGIKIFDRSKQPVIPTELGMEFINHALRIMEERDGLIEMVNHRKGIVAGELKIGIIPTLAPYLLPLFVKEFTTQYPEVRLVVNEMMTDIIVQRLREGKIDAGILVTPLMEQGIREDLLFYEELVVYVSKNNQAYEKQYVLARDIDPNKLWLLEEGHCFRSQIMNLCELQKASKLGHRFEYEAGSIETLRRMVEINDGITILPELSTIDLPARQQQMIRQFRKPVPMRQVSLVVHRDFIKKKLLDILKREIIAAVPEKIKRNSAKNVV
ncbi:MAG: LysR family transcriptional regulator, partial [Chitinophagaceae bacterium]|nr:LysR family transcriptional regulator [Chitinophagaceae bacterium]